MSRYVLLAIGALIALYLIWNAVQFFAGIFKDRRPKRKG